MAIRSVVTLLVALCFTATQVCGSRVPVETQVPWMKAQATVYGDSQDTINGGACGYGVLYNNGYGGNTAAISSALFEGGAGCGACFEVKCDGTAAEASRWCQKSASRSVVVTATNLCPPSSVSQWCNLPRRHFDMADTAFYQIVDEDAVATSVASSYDVVLPIIYRRVPCTRKGGMHFTIDGNSIYNTVLLTNVGGIGEVAAVSVKGSRTGWLPLTRTWGSNWKTSRDLTGQSLSFQVVLSDGTSVTSYNVAPASWKIGQTFEGNQAP